MLTSLGDIVQVITEMKSKKENSGKSEEKSGINSSSLKLVNQLSLYHEAMLVEIENRNTRIIDGLMNEENEDFEKFEELKGILEKSNSDIREQMSSIVDHSVRHIESIEKLMKETEKIEDVARSHHYRMPKAPFVNKSVQVGSESISKNFEFLRQYSNNQDPQKSSLDIHQGVLDNDGNLIEGTASRTLPKTRIKAMNCSIPDLENLFEERENSNFWFIGNKIDDFMLLFDSNDHQKSSLA
jgi:hypothetical protein